MDHDDALLQIQDPSQLIQEDLTEAFRWQRAYQSGGVAKLSRLMDELAETDAVQHFRLLEAFWPETVRKTIHDQLAGAGLNEEAIQLLTRKLESRLRDH